MVEFVHGTRSCDGDVNAHKRGARLKAWGAGGMVVLYIPNRDVWFGNNVIANPAANLAAGSR